MQSFITDWLAARFLDRLAASPRGRVFILRFLVQAEEGDEAGIFDQLIDRMEGVRLQKLMERHRDDEARHASLFRLCLARQAVAESEVPAPESVVALISAHAHEGDDASELRNDHDAMLACALLQVIEERGVAWYPLIAAAVAPYDARSAETITQVADDEVRHVAYARAIGKHFAPDERTRVAMVERYRAAEARAFDELGRIITEQAVAHDLLACGWIERQLWRGLVALNPPSRVDPDVGFTIA